MRRRKYLQALTATSILGLSGCAKYNPFQEDSEPPTDAQLEYIEFYPDQSESSNFARLRLRREEDVVGVVPSYVGDFKRFEIYTVQPNGNGEKLGELPPTEDQRSTKGVPLFPLSSTQDGNVLLILSVEESNKKYTYGAYYDTGESFEQIAYTQSSQSANNSTNSNSSE